MKKLILIAFLSLSSAMATEVNTKAMTDFDTVDVGIEFLLQSGHPQGFGVVGIDLDDGLPVFNFGYNHRFDDFDLLLFTGFGFKRETVTRTVTTSVTAGAVSSQGCQNGKGKGVQQSCGSGGTGGTGGTGSTGGTGGTGGTSSSQTTTLQLEEKNVFQEVGLRLVPHLDDSLNPLIEFTSATDDAGFNFEHKIKLGLIYKF